MGGALMSEIVIKKVSEIKVIDALYPRGDDKDTKLIQRYASDLEVLPPIEINQDNILIDGFHRLSAHKQCKIEKIPCIITNTACEDDLFWLAVRKNNSHGWQLSIENKKRIAIERCGGTKDDEFIRKELSIGLSTFNSWTKNKREQLEKDRDTKIMDLWLQCCTQEEISEKFDISQKTVSNRIDILSKSAIDSKITKDFTPQLYNIWNFAKNNNETKHFGNVPTEITENLLYAYTQPFDVVFDPFGGGGATIDACKKWYRRYFVSDIQPSEISLQKGMRTHDITTGLPEEFKKAIEEL